ncbi:restriction endonuclease subunit S [Vibrio lentus]|uniref:restriction endonuclease subunit S n=1 Tax=Vibrio lentus TaxID=136468 RepID=UPI000C821EDC|nr:restriction endonuclease subunit S [Vibrio lentus]PMG65684.1 restriction endonuclease [Vibrio lentus]
MSWPLVSLSSIAEVVTGNTPSKADESFFGGDIPFVSPSELDLGYVSSSKQTLTTKGASVSRLIPADSVMVCCIGSLGKVGISSIPVVTNQQINSLVVNHEVAYPLYVYYFCKTLKNTLNDMAPKTTVAIVNKTKFSALKIPLPPLETQKQIAAVLEKADQLRKDCQQMEQELNSLAQSVFIDMFGDPVTNPKGWDVGIIGEMLSSANYGTSEKSSTEKKKFPVLRMNNITYEGNWDFSALKYMDMSKEDENKYLVKSGDILFNRTNSKELVGKTAVYREATSMAYAGYLVRARCNELAHPDYISSFMNSKYGKKTLQSMCKSIVGMANINAKEFQKIKIAKPPVELQEKFAIRVAAIRTKVADVKQQEAEYNLLFNALMQKAFKGELNL